MTVPTGKAIVEPVRTIAAAALLFLGACSKEGPIPLADAQSREMIREAIKTFHEAHDKADMATIKGLLAPDVSLVLSPEDVIRGYDDTLKALNKQINAVDSPRSTITGKEMISIKGETALVTYIASLNTTQRGVITAIYTRNKDNKWVISHLHETWSPPTKK